MKINSIYVTLANMQRNAVICDEYETCFKYPRPLKLPVLRVDIYIFIFPTFSAEKMESAL